MPSAASRSVPSAPVVRNPGNEKTGRADLPTRGYRVRRNRDAMATYRVRIAVRLAGEHAYARISAAVPAMPNTT